MFNNKFNSSKKDPLVEAVENAMKDGNLRREAERLVNEHFGVFSRKAVVRENLAAYDAALEEAYKCMKEDDKWEGSKEDTDEDKKLAKKHGMTLAQWEKSDADKKHDKHEKKEKKKHGKDIDEELAKKDYDKDGKVESPKDEVWGSRLRAAKMAGKLKEEEQLDELSPTTLKSYIKKADRQGSSLERKVRDMKDKPGEENKMYNRIYGADLARKKTAVRVAAKEEVDYSAQDRAPVTKSAPKEDPSTPKSYPGAASSAPTAARLSNAKAAVSPIKEGQADPTGNAVTAPKEWAMKAKTPNKNAVTKAPVPGVSIAEEEIDEAAYSAKAAAAGKDIGKPGKQFAKIAAKAGKKYGSKERGKAVAGAVLKRIRAKHMEESAQIDELSGFEKAFASAKGKNFSFGGKEYSGARADKASSTPKPAATNTPGTQGVATGKSFDAIDKAKSFAAKVPSATNVPTPPKKPESLSLPSIDKGPAAGPASVPTPAPKAAPSVPTPPSRPAGLGNSEPGSGASSFVRKQLSMNEEVQVGTNKYRIV